MIRLFIVLLALVGLVFGDLFQKRKFRCPKKKTYYQYNPGPFKLYSDAVEAAPNGCTLTPIRNKKELEKIFDVAYGKYPDEPHRSYVGCFKDPIRAKKDYDSGIPSRVYTGWRNVDGTGVPPGVFDADRDDINVYFGSVLENYLEVFQIGYSMTLNDVSGQTGSKGAIYKCCQT